MSDQRIEEARSCRVCVTAASGLPTPGYTHDPWCSTQRIEEAAREIAGVIEFGHFSDFEPILQRLFDDGKKAGREERGEREAKLLEALEKIASLRVAWPEKDPGYGSMAVMTARAALQDKA